MLECLNSILKQFSVMKNRKLSSSCYSDRLYLCSIVFSKWLFNSTDEMLRFLTLTAPYITQTHVTLGALVASLKTQLYFPTSNWPHNGDQGNRKIDSSSHRDWRTLYMTLTFLPSILPTWNWTTQKTHFNIKSTYLNQLEEEKNNNRAHFKNIHEETW